MAKLTIGGHSVTISDSFKSLSPEEQQKAVDEIAQNLPSKVAATAQLDAPEGPQADDGTMQNVVRSVRGGFPFGDRIAAAAKTVEPHVTYGNGKLSFNLGNGKGYGENFADERNKAEAYANKHPVASAVGGLTGMAASLPFTPLKLLGGAVEGASLANKAYEAAKGGAALGGVFGVSEANNLLSPTDVLAHGLSGAAIGGALGAGTPIAGKLIGGAVSPIVNHFQGYDGIGGRTARSLGKALQQTVPGDVEASVDRLGPDATLMDASPAFLGKAFGVSGNSPEARTMISDMLTTRNNGTSNRLLGDVSANYGGAQSPASLDKALKSELKSTDYKNYEVDAGLVPGNDLLPKVDVQSLIDHLNHQIPYAEGAEKKALVEAKNRLLIENPEKPDPSQFVSAVDFMPKAPKDKKTQTIVQFLRAAGGVKDEGGDLVSQGLNKKHKGLINPNGMGLDEARELAAQEGYLGDNIDEAMANSLPQDLIDAIHANSHSVHDRETQWAREGYDRQLGDNSYRTYWKEAKKQADEANAKLKEQFPDKIPKSNPVNLHKIKGEFDNLIEHDLPGLGVQPSEVKNQQRALSDVRKKLNLLLEDQVDGYKEANRESSKLRGRIEALKQGYELFGGKPGQSTMWPSDLETLRKSLGSANVDFRNGARAKIEEKFRTTANDLTAGKSVAGGDNDFKRELLNQVFGEDETRNVLNAVEREKQFANTHQKVNQNSVTAPKQQATKEEAPNKTGIVAGLWDFAKKNAIDPVTDNLFNNEEFYKEAAKILTAQGPERDKYLKTLSEGLKKTKDSKIKVDDLSTKATLAAALAGGRLTRSVINSALDHDRR